MRATPNVPRDPPVATREPSPAWLLGLFAIWLLATLGLRPLLLPDEGRYADVARAMWQGSGLVPTLDGLPFFHKPPLFYWIDIAAMQVFGATEFASRMGSALGAWLMGASLYGALRRWHGAAIARVALGVLATTPFFFAGAQYANHDMLVGGLITAAVLALARSLDRPPGVDLAWLVAGWAFCALALLAKGLIGVVLPALVIGPWLLAQGRWRQMVRLLHPLGLAVFAIVGLPWFVLMQVRYPGFFDYFVVEQHFRRFADSTFNNVHGVWFFFVVVPLLSLPWSGWLPAALRRGPPREPMTWLMAWWVVAVVGFFSIPSSKLVGYVLPA
ncbi:MAG: glycosyltransferase family 39 protein, partial [Pseudomonadota bacterium]|nr:glycosyltransferase family 39 protein [Pseudomonadota bacterium]